MRVRKWLWMMPQIVNWRHWQLLLSVVVPSILPFVVLVVQLLVLAKTLNVDFPFRICGFNVARAQAARFSRWVIGHYWLALAGCVCSIDASDAQLTATSLNGEVSLFATIVGRATSLFEGLLPAGCVASNPHFSTLAVAVAAAAAAFAAAWAGLYVAQACTCGRKTEPPRKPTTEVAAVDTVGSFFGRTRPVELRVPPAKLEEGSCCAAAGFIVVVVAVVAATSAAYTAYEARFHEGKETAKAAGETADRLTQEHGRHTLDDWNDVVNAEAKDLEALGLADQVESALRIDAAGERCADAVLRALVEESTDGLPTLEALEAVAFAEAERLSVDNAECRWAVGDRGKAVRAALQRSFDERIASLESQLRQRARKLSRMPGAPHNIAVANAMLGLAPSARPAELLSGSARQQLANDAASPQTSSEQVDENADKEPENDERDGVDDEDESIDEVADAALVRLVKDEIPGITDADAERAVFHREDWANNKRIALVWNHYMQQMRLQADGAEVAAADTDRALVRVLQVLDGIDTEYARELSAQQQNASQLQLVSSQVTGFVELLERREQQQLQERREMREHQLVLVNDALQAAREAAAAIPTHVSAVHSASSSVVDPVELVKTVFGLQSKRELLLDRRDRWLQTVSTGWLVVLTFGSVMHGILRHRAAADRNCNTLDAMYEESSWMSFGGLVTKLRVGVSFLLGGCDSGIKVVVGLTGVQIAPLARWLFIAAAVFITYAVAALLVPVLIQLALFMTMRNLGGSFDDFGSATFGAQLLFAWGIGEVLGILLETLAKVHVVRSLLLEDSSSGFLPQTRVASFWPSSWVTGNSGDPKSVTRILAPALMCLTAATAYVYTSI